MVLPGRKRLSATVEADTRWARRSWSRSRWRRTRPAWGRARLRGNADVSAASVEVFVLDAVEPGGRIRTDAWPSYTRLQGLGSRHEKAVTGGDTDRLERDIPQVHRMAVLLKRWLLKTRWGNSIWTTTSTSLGSGSTGGHPVPAACCSTGCCIRRSQRIRSRARR